MSPDTIFAQAIEIASDRERAAFLEEACGADAGLRREVEHLVRDHFRAGAFLERPVARLAATADEAPLSERPGTAIGAYKLMEEIGEGGMGLVFVAEQQQPVRRKVALKVIKPGMDTRQVVARFEAERQALALMDHPNIAKVHDGGTTASGRPYFVMELVKGVPITQFCDDNCLPVRQRLELFLDVCSAVQHAHQKGIIHRDIKPSNVLVASHDGTPVVKVIDFGLAKAIGQQLTDKTIYTQLSQLVGTPLYMSPEQAGQSSLDVDTRTDVYALGVLLYELLTGTTPFDGERMRTVGYDEMRRIIREEEPVRPSTRISTLGLAADTVSTNRKSEPKKLSQLLRGELDWIVMRALEKDRNRRYESASAFAADVGRYLRDEPVQACPPSTIYRLKKFVRRNKGPALAGSTMILLLVAGVVGTSIGMVRAEQRAEGERRAKDTAEKRLDQVEKGIDALASVFENLDPTAEAKEGRPLRAILGDRLDRAAAQLEGDAVGDPLVVARLQDRLGLTYRGLGHAAKAEALFNKALATRRAELGEWDPLTLASMQHQALALDNAGKCTRAVALLEQVRDAREKVLEADHPDTLDTLYRLGKLYLDVGRTADGIALYEKLRETQEKKYGPDHPSSIQTLHAMGLAYQAVGRKAEAIAACVKVRDAFEKRRGRSHPETIVAMISLAQAYMAAGRNRAATSLLREALDKVVPKLGEDHPHTLHILTNLAAMYMAAGKTAEAIKLGEQVRAKRVLYLGAYHPATLETLNTLALAYQASGDLTRAMPLFQQAATGVETLDFAHKNAGHIIDSLCGCHAQLKQYEQAETWQRKWLAVVKERTGPDSGPYAEALEGLGFTLLKQRRYADAEPVLRECLAIYQKKEKEPEGLGRVKAQAMLGGALVGQKKYAEAEPHLVEGYQGLSRWAARLGPAHDSIFRGPVIQALKWLVQLYEATNNPAEVAKWRKELEARGETEAITKPADR